MKKSTWGYTPPQTQMLANSKIRIYLNVQAGKETNIQKDEDGNTSETETDVYTADEIDIEAPLTYNKVVEALIRERYSVSDELAVLRQQASKPEEFKAYNDYAEECKTLARSINY